MFCARFRMGNMRLPALLAPQGCPREFSFLHDRLSVLVAQGCFSPYPSALLLSLPLPSYFHPAHGTEPCDFVCHFNAIV